MVNFFLFCCCSSKISAITRASDDYYPENPSTQTLHIAAVSYNSIFLGEVVVPDWDMFYVWITFLLLNYCSTLLCAETNGLIYLTFRASMMQLNFMLLLELLEVVESMSGKTNWPCES